MRQGQLAPVAQHLITSYLEVGAYSRQFRDEHGSPPSLMAKVHHMRSVIQALFVADGNYDLCPRYVDYGRVEFTDVETGESFLLKSSRAVAIETATTSQDDSLFPVRDLIRPSNVEILVYRFQSTGLELSLAPASTRGRSERLLVADTPVPIGTWAYQPDDLDDQTKPFDQDARDTFRDIGDIGHDEDAGGFE